MPAVPAPPPGATTIVLNWHWACAAAPPQLDIAGATVCVSCNIAISVRVGSPGDTGDVTQTVAAQAAAVAADVAHTVQSAVQPTASVVPTTPAAVPPVPALPSIPPVPTVPSVPTAPFRALSVTAPVPAAQPYVPMEAGILFAGPPEGGPADDPPRHGAPASYGGAAALPLNGTHGVAAQVAILSPVVAARENLPAQGSSAGRVGAGSRKSGARRPAPVPSAPDAPPSAPSPFVLAAGAPAAHGGGPGAVAAIVTGFALALLYAVYTALRTPSVVPPARETGARPHPPG